MQTIRIECQGSRTLDIDELHVLQNNLKELSKENAEKLKKEIIALGFSEPSSVWLHEGKWWLLNGTQRYRVLSQLRREGWDIPPIPVSEVQARDMKEAKKKILSLTSQFGVLSNKSLFDFMADADLKFEDVTDFRFPEVSFEELKDEFFGGEKEDSIDEETEEVSDDPEDVIPDLPTEPVTKLGEKFNIGGHKIKCGEALSFLKTLDENSIDAAVTDPPYGISFMNKKWDYDIPKTEVWKEVLRVLKPGGHALIACGTRTQHRMVCNIEDAGFEVRDVITWLYGSGFPKSLDISKAIDKEAGAERKSIGKNPNWRPAKTHGGAGFDKLGKGEARMELTAAESILAKQFEGWGTALKPACEFWTLVRKPISEKTVAKNVEKWGTGGINVDGCRIEGKPRNPGYSNPGSQGPTAERNIYGSHDGLRRNNDGTARRFPANLILDEAAGEMLDGQSGILKTGGQKLTSKRGFQSEMVGGKCKSNHESYSATQFIGDQGGASRFFYCAKASKSERNAGLEGMSKKKCGMMEDDNYPIKTGSGNLRNTKNENFHPTVKPLSLMQYLIRLITPPGGIVLDCYLGSGSTLVACEREGMKLIGCELDPAHVDIIKGRAEASLKSR